MTKTCAGPKPRFLPPLPKPDDDEVPEWSAETENALNQLTPIERSFVEHLTSGCTNAEAYRRASGVAYDDRDSDTTRKRAWRFMTRPRVQKALALAMKDQNFEARMSRAWMLQRLELALDSAEEDSPGLPAARIVQIIAKLKGEYLPRVPQQINEPQEPSPALKRFNAALADANARAATAKTEATKKAPATSAMPYTGCAPAAEPTAATKVQAAVEPQASAPSQPADSLTAAQRREQERAAESRRQKIIDEQREAERIAGARRDALVAQQEAAEREETRLWLDRQARQPKPFMGATIGY